MIKIAEIAQELKISEEEIMDCMKGLDNFIVNDYLTVMGCVFLSRILPRETALEFVKSHLANNTGHDNTGSFNTGNNNTGSFNSGSFNSGNWNTSNNNTGDSNTGYGNTGSYNTGNRNDGSGNTGYGNTGDFNSGSRNDGNGNTGDWNRCDFATGCFNTVSPQLFFFNRPTDWTHEKWENSDAYYILMRMPKKTEEAMKWWRRLSDQQRGIIMDLPNFDKDIFEEITGIKVD